MCTDSDEAFRPARRPLSSLLSHYFCISYQNKNPKKKSKHFNINPEEIMNNIKNKNKNLLQNNNEKANDSDDSSVNVSTMSGMNLEKIKSENLKPIIYTSQSFAIDKNIFKNIQNEIPKIGLYKNLNNKYPMRYFKLGY